MNIWTTKRLKDLLLNDVDNVNILNVDMFEVEFYKKANFTDVVVLEYYENFKNFLNTAVSKGYNCLNIFCDFKKNQFLFLPAYNTIVLDVNKLGMDVCKEMIKFIIDIHKNKMKFLDLYSVKDVKFDESEEVYKTEIKTEIFEKLSYCFKNKFNVVMSVPVFEDGRKVMARGTGYIKEINENFFVIDKIKPSLLVYRVKIDETLNLVFSDGSFFYESVCKVRNKTDYNIFLDLPNVIESERRKYVRVEPSYKNPVQVYIHIPGEENEVVDCLEISITGTSIILQRDLVVNGIYTFGIKLPNESRFIISDGIIRNKIAVEDKFRYGIEFQFAEKDVDLIANYIRKREVEILDLLKNEI